MDAYGISVLVRGAGEYASAIARELFLAGNAVVLHQATPPTEIRRQRCYADAWYSQPSLLGSTPLDGVFARRVDTSPALTASLGRRDAIPLAAMPLEQVIDAWPWAVLIDARMPDKLVKPQRHLAGLTIGLGPGFLGGETVDLVIGTDDHNPGAFLPPGCCAAAPVVSDEPHRTLCRAPHAGVFHTECAIGDTVQRGDCVGWLGATAIHVPDHAPSSSLVRGLCRDGNTVGENDEILDLAPPGSKVNGISVKARQITRAVMLAIACDGVPFTTLRRSNP